ncbi:SNF2-related protein [Bradyrhizobium cenepequi]
MSLIDGQWVLDDVPPHVAIKLKAVFPKIPKTQTKRFSFRNAKEHCADLEWFLTRYPMDLDPSARGEMEAGSRTFVDNRNAIEDILKEDWLPRPVVGFKDGFSPNLIQSQAIEITHRLGRLLVVDDAGLGKTWTAMGTMMPAEYRPAAVVMQAHLPTQWKKKFLDPYTYLSSHIIGGKTPYYLPPADVYLFKYSNIAGWCDIAATGKFKSVFFDEIQELRTGEEAEKGSAAKVFAHNAQLVQGLSATPIYNYGSEMFNIMEIVAPGSLGTWDEFVREWCKMGPGQKWIVEDPDALGAYLREMQLMVRREREGRPINKLVFEVEYDDEKAQSVVDLAVALAQRVMTGGFTESGQAARELDMLARMTTGVAKARSVAAYCRMLVKSGPPIILTGWHRDVYEIWLKELAEFNPVMYTGSESPTQKDAAEREFVSGRSQIMIMSLRSGTGLDGLQKRACNVVHGEFDWSPKVHDQITWRLDRPGQPEPEVTAHFPYVNCGSDPVIMGVLGLKADQSRGILNPLEGAKPVHSDVSRVKALAERYLAGGV